MTIEVWAKNGVWIERGGGETYEIKGKVEV